MFFHDGKGQGWIWTRNLGGKNRILWTHSTSTGNNSLTNEDTAETAKRYVVAEWGNVWASESVSGTLLREKLSFSLV